MSRTKRPALGRGLGALLPGKPAEAPAATTEAAPAPAAGPPRELDIERLQPNPEQPRKKFEPGRLEELAASIRTQGILQPILVTPAPAVAGRPSTYIIVAGERRWRAAQKAGLHRVPVVVREELDEPNRLELALIENIQRADLDPIEEARAYAQLIDLHDYTQEELAARVGKDRSTVANAMRLLKLPPKVQEMLAGGRLSMGHARALLGLGHEDDMNQVAAEVVRQGLSVRATEQAVRKRAQAAAAPKPADDEGARRKIIVEELENRLRRRLGTRVRLRPQGSKGAGTVEIPYSSLDELDRLLKVIMGS